MKTCLKSHEFFTLFWSFFSLTYNAEEIIGKYEGNTFTIYAKFLLHVSQKVSKINVKNLTI